MNHVGLIPDGGRRWAAARGCSLLESYTLSMRKLEEMVEALFAFGVLEVSIYLLSKKNLRRSQEDLVTVATAESQFIAESLPQVAKRYPHDVRIAGQWSLAPAELRDAIGGLRASGKASRVVTLAVAYDPIDELTEAFPQGAHGSAEEVRARLWVPTPLDLVVRTGGAITLSDFLPLQAAYAQLVFLDVLFNDLPLAHLMDLVVAESRRNHKFGQ